MGAKVNRFGDTGCWKNVQLLSEFLILPTDFDSEEREIKTNSSTGKLV